MGEEYGLGLLCYLELVGNASGSGHIFSRATAKSFATAIMIDAQQYWLLDSPGLDNPAISDASVFEGIARFLLEE
jgi:hypothetical protein